MDEGRKIEKGKIDVEFLLPSHCLSEVAFCQVLSAISDPNLGPAWDPATKATGPTWDPIAHLPFHTSDPVDHSQVLLETLLSIPLILHGAILTNYQFPPETLFLVPQVQLETLLTILPGPAWEPADHPPGPAFDPIDHPTGPPWDTTGLHSVWTLVNVSFNFSTRHEQAFQNPDPDISWHSQPDYAPAWGDCEGALSSTDVTMVGERVKMVSCRVGCYMCRKTTRSLLAYITYICFY